MQTSLEKQSTTFRMSSS